MSIKVSQPLHVRKRSKSLCTAFPPSAVMSYLNCSLRMWNPTFVPSISATVFKRLNTPCILWISITPCNCVGIISGSVCSWDCFCTIFCKTNSESSFLLRFLLQSPSTLSGSSHTSTCKGQALFICFVAMSPSWLLSFSSCVAITSPSGLYQTLHCVTVPGPSTARSVHALVTRIVDNNCWEHKLSNSHPLPELNWVVPWLVSIFCDFWRPKLIHEDLIKY